MSQATDPEQQREYWTLLARVEDAVANPSALGQAESDIGAANLAAADRAELQGLCDSYRADWDRLSDPVEQGARGDAPLIAGRARMIADTTEEDVTDAALDAEDGFEVVGLPA